MSAKELLRKIIRLAASRKWPIYLEATLIKSLQLFNSVGFDIAPLLTPQIAIRSVDGLFKFHWGLSVVWSTAGLRFPHSDILCPIGFLLLGQALS